MGGAWLASWGNTCTVLVFPNGRDTESCFLAAIKLPNMVVTLPVVSQPRSLLCFAQASKQMVVWLIRSGRDAPIHTTAQLLG